MVDPEFGELNPISQGPASIKTFSHASREFEKVTKTACGSKNCRGGGGCEGFRDLPQDMCDSVVNGLHSALFVFVLCRVHTGGGVVDLRPSDGENAQNIKGFHIGWAVSGFLTSVKILMCRHQSQHDAQ